MADLRIVFNMASEEQPMDIDDEAEEAIEESDDQGQRSFSTINSGIMAFNDSSIPSPLDVTTPEELLTPLARLRCFAKSDNIFNRRMVAHDACHILESLEDNSSDFETAVQCYITLSEDLEPSVRVELMEQIVEITERFHERVLDTAVVPILLRYLTDVNNQVRKTCHGVLIDIIKRGFLEVSRFELEILPLLKDLTSRKQAPDEYRTEAIALICQVCECFTPEFVKQNFLPMFLESCQDETIFHVRKVCASNFSIFCNIFDETLVNQELLPRFIDLCRDNVWGVRKSCAESFPEFAKYISEDVRIHTLSPVFSSLLSDQSRWVRVAAFESLGPFISTFADSSKAEDSFSQNPEDSKKTENDDSKRDFDSFLFWRDPIPPVTFDEDFDDLTAADEPSQEEEIPTQLYINSASLLNSLGLQSAETQQDDLIIESNDHDENVYSPTKDDILKSVEFSAEKENIAVNFNIKIEESESATNDDLVTGEQNPPAVVKLMNTDEAEQSDDPSKNGEEVQEQSAEGSDAKENNLDATTDPAGGDSSDLLEKQNQDDTKPAENHDSSDSGDSDDDFFDENEPRNWQTPHLMDFPDIYDSESNQACEIDYRIFSSGLADIGYTGTDRLSDPFDSFSVTSPGPKPNIQQNVIPQPLLENFISMTDPSRKQTVDSEISKHCAYSLPGVAYTLGRNNWHCLKDVYQKLASDVLWKVRRTIASSIHELAKILGEDLTTTELVPIFNGFLKDLDDVRIGVLYHLSDFLKLLKPEVRGIYLYHLTDFLSIDNNRNWRFRHELAKQLGSLVDLYDSSDIVKYICPLAMHLASDRVVAVQEEAAKLMSTLLMKLHNDSSESEENHFKVFTAEIISKIASSTKWKERALFCKMCNFILHDVTLPFGIFLRNFSAPLVQLSSDKIVNVRILTAKVLSYAVKTFCDEGEGEEISAALKDLENDKDRDVRFYAAV